MLKALKTGNPRVFVVLAERAYGKVKEQVEVQKGAGRSPRSAPTRARDRQPLSDKRFLARGQPKYAYLR